MLPDISLDGKVVDPVSEQLGHFLALPLRCHMTCPVNSREVKTFVADKVPGDLTIGVPWRPVFLDWPVEHLDPPAGAVGRNCTVGITRVEEHLISILFHNFIDPEGTLILVSIVFINGVVAL